MSFENAKSNLKEFGKELNLEGLEFDENNTCILGIDDEFSLHITYEPNSKRLYIYSPLLDGLPRDDKARLRLYERLLEGSMLGGQMAGGGVGVAVKEELILIHCTIDMEHAVSSALRAFAPLFVETVEKWRKICRDISEGREETPGANKPPQQALPGGVTPGSTGRGGQGQGGQGYIKI
ncbi:MAG: CesT family type III secretion system chaperone [Parachlamydiaceae bacterium]|nr:CesT family type III secretion system chaperone [Parachlamydiaceae bacterium]